MKLHLAFSLSSLLAGLGLWVIVVPMPGAPMLTAGAPGPRGPSHRKPGL